VLRSFISSSRKKIDSDLSKSPLRKMFSPIVYSQYEMTIPTAQKYVHGDLLDIGCGYSPYRNLLIEYVSKYEGIDINKYNEEVTIVGNILEGDLIPKNHFDCIVCFEVLEHIPNSDTLLKKINEILRKEGFVVISVPHLSRLHEEPLDFFRFTKYGLIEIFSRNGFEILEIKHKGSIFSFLGHQISTILVSFFWGIPIISHFILFLNYIFITLPCYYVDKAIDKNGKFAQGYVLVAKIAKKN